MERDTRRLSSELDSALDKLEQEVRDGLRHGFFEYVVSGEIVSGQKRRLTIKAGRSYQFTIRQDDLRP